jgi:quaternary ammonium compound-resistance protein SugE
MKRPEAFTKPLPSATALLGMILSVWFLSLALKSLLLGTAYAIWTGIGAAGAFIVGVAFLGKSLTFARALAACPIVTGLALMKASRSV